MFKSSENDDRFSELKNFKKSAFGPLLYHFGLVSLHRILLLRPKKNKSFQYLTTIQLLVDFEPLKYHPKLVNNNCSFSSISSFPDTCSIFEGESVKSCIFFWIIRNYYNLKLLLLKRFPIKHLPQL